MTESTLAERVGAASDPALPTHPDIATWRTATVDDVDAVHAVLAAADAVDHPTWTTPREEVAENFALSHVDPARDILLAFAPDGSPVAAGSAMRHPSLDEHVHVNLIGAVRPDWRGRGVGARLFGWQHARAEQQLAEVGGADDPAAHLPGEIHVYAGEKDAALERIGTTHGYRTERWFSTMHRDLREDVPELTAPAEIELVPYSADRAEDARLARNDAFRDHWGSLPSPSERWQQFVGGAFLRPDLCTLALDVSAGGGDRIVAFCLASVNEGDWEVLGPHAYIDLIGVVRSHRRRGLAPLIIARSLAAMRDAGLGMAVLDVDTESPTGANALYGGLGFTAYERDRVLVRRY
ncbi:GNAT family N-acetyltransferase [Microbacterium radiodurans]|uniref:GNAT family N-acetyltransferase n=1 Tax=Microbacterium radiodurans TaxID=661398 RepID=A0A5J5IVV9_9MICO|nr:GNAT family N-acetyltransferase [Microbacterium radiodurans]KAA9088962.1 GNAT family N-acetyltransferase [Microbacterium radiodurans]